MNLLTADQITLITGGLGFLITVALLSYLIGDNLLYRIAIHLFVGVAAGYAVLVVIYQVLRPRLIEPLLSGNPETIAVASVPLMLLLFLVLKLSPRTSAIGNISIAYLIGVGTAVAVGGAITGTLLPQVQATGQLLGPGEGQLLNNIIILLGTVATLLFFQYWLRKRAPSGEIKRSPIMRAVVAVGQTFLTITLGTIYGGLILSGIAILGEQVASLYHWINALIG
nr:hypothetical protein [Anaerolineae bacterium]